MIVMMVPYSKWIFIARVNISLILEVASVCENLTSSPLCVCFCVCVCVHSISECSDLYHLECCHNTHTVTVIGNCSLLKHFCTRSDYTYDIKMYAH